MENNKEKSKKKNTGRFLVATGAIIEHKKSREILLLKRSLKDDFEPGVWEDITGRLEQFEEPESGLKREIFEETGLKNIKIVKPLKIFHIFRGKKIKANELVGIIYWCQTPSKKVILSEEHVEYKWLRPKQALKFVVHPGIKKDILAFIREAK
ncbi:MAG: NUDIX domain-containing protein [Patescibacteria group bacterium]|nr:NUDIX domain-containing protein [Patescibacteria group bacterium]